MDNGQPTSMTSFVTTLLAVLLAAAAPKLAQKGEQLVKHAQLEFRLGDFEGALAELSQAYDLAPAPLLLYDIALCHRALHQPRRTAFFLRKYLGVAPQGASARRARELLAELENERPSPAAVQPPPAVPKVAPTLTAVPLRHTVVVRVRHPVTVPEAALTDRAAPQPATPPGAIWLGGGGVAALGAGAILGLLATNQRGADQVSAGSGGVALHSITYPQFQAANHEAFAADALLSVGGAIVVAAVVWALAGHRDGPPPIVPELP